MIVRKTKEKRRRNELALWRDSSTSPVMYDDYVNSQAYSNNIAMYIQ